jgi:environmental stress-induced protein Ves
MRILRAENYRRMQWKNGGGETAEIAVSPDSAGLDDFDWRISMATGQASGGPFSMPFPGSTARCRCWKARGSCCRSKGTFRIATLTSRFPAR